MRLSAFGAATATASLHARIEAVRRYVDADPIARVDRGGNRHIWQCESRELCLPQVTRWIWPRSASIVIACNLHEAAKRNSE